MSGKRFIIFVERNNVCCENLLFIYKQKQSLLKNALLYILFLKRNDIIINYSIMKGLLSWIFIYLLYLPLYCLFNYLAIVWYHMVFWMGFCLLIYIYILIEEKMTSSQKNILFYIFGEKWLCHENSFLFINFCFNFYLEVTWICHAIHLLYRGKWHYPRKPLLYIYFM